MNKASRKGKDPGHIRTGGGQSTERGSPARRDNPGAVARERSTSWERSGAGRVRMLLLLAEHMEGVSMGCHCHSSVEPTPGSSPWQGTGCPTGWDSISNQTNKASRLRQAAVKNSSQAAAGDWGIFLEKNKRQDETSQSCKEDTEPSPRSR